MSRRQLVRLLGLTGAALGVVAGVVQITVGAEIPAWTGAKSSPTGLGLLTVVLSIVAGLAASRQHDATMTVLGRAACAVALIGPGLLCLSTVGRLWYLPAVLLVVAGALTVESWRETLAALVQHWYRVLLSCLGGFEILMVVSASPPLVVMGGLGGTALILAAWLPTRSRRAVVVLVVAGAVPFAVLGSTVGVPVLVAVLAGLLTVPLLREMRAAALDSPGHRHSLRPDARSRSIPADMVRGWAWVRFLAAYALLWGVLAGSGQLDASGRWGLAILALVAATALVVELLLYRTSLRDAVRFLGLGRSTRPALAGAAVISAIIVLIFPATAALTGASIDLVGDWLWIALGLFAFHGLAEELVWRGFVFRRLSSGRSFARAVWWTMPFIALAHVPMFLTSGPVIAAGALLVAAVTSIPLGYLYTLGRSTIWAPALVHTAIDSFKLVSVPASAAPTFSVLLIGVSLVVPFLAFLIRREPLSPHPAQADQLIGR